MATKLEKLAAELTTAIIESPLAAAMVAHGLLRVDKKIARAYDATPAELGKVADLLNRVNQSDMMKGTLLSVRATLSGRGVFSVDDSLIGKIIALAMNNLVSDAIASVRSGHEPKRLYKRAIVKGGSTQDVLDFNLARATIGALGLTVPKDERNRDGYEKVLIAQARANRDALVTAGKFVEEAPESPKAPVQTPKMEIEDAQDEPQVDPAAEETPEFTEEVAEEVAA